MSYNLNQNLVAWNCLFLGISITYTQDIETNFSTPKVMSGYWVNFDFKKGIFNASLYQRKTNNLINAYLCEYY